MKSFICKTCGYASINGSAPDKCPVCMSPKEVFEEKDVIKTSKDEGPGEKHVPILNVVKTCGLMGEGCMDVHAKIGEVEHPMEPDHFIVFVDFYVDNEWVSRTHLTPHLKPAAAIHLKAKTGKLTAIEFCNKHGYWINETDL